MPRKSIKGDGGFDGQVIKSGKLKKRGKTRMKAVIWKERFAHLSTSGLRYFNSKNKLKGELLFEGQQVVVQAMMIAGGGDHEEHPFNIEVGKEKAVFSAASQDEMQEWVEAIRTALGMEVRASERLGNEESQSSPVQSPGASKWAGVRAKFMAGSPMDDSDGSYEDESDSDDDVGMQSLSTERTADLTKRRGSTSASNYRDIIAQVRHENDAPDSPDAKQTEERKSGWLYCKVLHHKHFLPILRPTNTFYQYLVLPTPTLSVLDILALLLPPLPPALHPPLR